MICVLDLAEVWEWKYYFYLPYILMVRGVKGTRVRGEAAF